MKFKKLLINDFIDMDKKIIIDTLEYEMANPDGSLLGKGITDSKENKLFYKENFSYYKIATEYRFVGNQANEGR